MTQEELYVKVCQGIIFFDFGYDNAEAFVKDGHLNFSIRKTPTRNEVSCTIAIHDDVTPNEMGDEIDEAIIKMTDELNEEIQNHKQHKKSMFDDPKTGDFAKWEKTSDYLTEIKKRIEHRKAQSLELIKRLKKIA